MTQPSVRWEVNRPSGTASGFRTNTFESEEEAREYVRRSPFDADHFTVLKVTVTTEPVKF